MFTKTAINIMNSKRVGAQTAQAIPVAFPDKATYIHISYPRNFDLLPGTTN